MVHLKLHIFPRINRFLYSEDFTYLSSLPNVSYCLWILNMFCIKKMCIRLPKILKSFVGQTVWSFVNRQIMLSCYRFKHASMIGPRLIEIDISIHFHVGATKRVDSENPYLDVNPCWRFRSFLISKGLIQTWYNILSK